MLRVRILAFLAVRPPLHVSAEEHTTRRPAEVGGDGSAAGEPCGAERPGAGRLVVPWAVAPVIDGEPRWDGSVPAWAVFVCGCGALFGCRGASVAKFLALV